VKQKSIRGLSVKVTGLGIMAHQNSTMTITNILTAKPYSTTLCLVKHLQQCGNMVAQSFL